MLTFFNANCQIVSVSYFGAFYQTQTMAKLFSSLFLLRFGSILRLLLCHSDYLCLSIQLSIPAIKLSIILSLFSNQLVIKFQPNNVSMSLFSCLYYYRSHFHLFEIISHFLLHSLLL